MNRRGIKPDESDTYTAVGAITGLRACHRVPGGIRQCTTEGEIVDGISLFDAADGIAVTVESDGFHRIEAGAAIADAALWMTGADGRAITYAAATGKYFAGKTDEAASGAGVIIVVHHEIAGAQ